jgi:hypothetical protein
MADEIRRLHVLTMMSVIGIYRQLPVQGALSRCRWLASVAIFVNLAVCVHLSATKMPKQPKGGRKYLTAAALR